jgi:hypothetical protein
MNASVQKRSAIKAAVNAQRKKGTNLLQRRLRIVNLDVAGDGSTLPAMPGRNKSAAQTFPVLNDGGVGGSQVLFGIGGKGVGYYRSWHLW